MFSPEDVRAVMKYCAWDGGNVNRPSKEDEKRYYSVVRRLREYEQRKYKPDFGDDRVCKCGHPYYRHFDTYDDMKPVGCKYCPCDTFKEA